MDVIILHFGPIFALLSLPLPNSLKNKNLKKKMKKKKPGDIIILRKCTKYYDHMMYGSWDMVHDKCNC